jgi:hypothetical protein
LASSTCASTCSSCALVVSGPAPALRAVHDHAERIRQETLAESLADEGELPYRDSFRIDDSDITIMLAKS